MKAKAKALLCLEKAKRDRVKHPSNLTELPPIRWDDLPLAQPREETKPAPAADGWQWDEGRKVWYRAFQGSWAPPVYAAPYAAPAPSYPNYFAAPFMGRGVPNCGPSG